MSKSPLSYSRLAPAKPSKIFDTYWYFAAERQAIFFRRLAGFPVSSWTTDSILSKYKFTNAYRASDRVSQYLIRNVIYAGDQAPDELFFRIILFKIFNRISTWELIQRELGTVSYADYSFKAVDRILSRAMASGQRIYSGAYIMPSGNRVFGYKRKHRNHLKMLESMMEDELPKRVVDARSSRRVFESLRSYPMMGDFLSYQYAIDLNYSDLLNFAESEYVVPGPGALSGISKCFSSLGGLTDANIIRHVTDRQEDEFSIRGIDFQTLWGRRLQLIDCQNLFCEVDKYSRAAHPEMSNGRKRIKQNYGQNIEPISYWYPPKWNINGRIDRVLGAKG